jgi:hypothetical protein
MVKGWVLAQSAKGLRTLTEGPLRFGGHLRATHPSSH